jgi:hypothetical protein
MGVSARPHFTLRRGHWSRQSLTLNAARVVVLHLQAFSDFSCGLPKE